LSITNPTWTWTGGTQIFAFEARWLITWESAMFFSLPIPLNLKNNWLIERQISRLNFRKVWVDLTNVATDSWKYGEKFASALDMMSLSSDNNAANVSEIYLSSRSTFLLGN
jgi:hypothetical protein